MKTALITTTVNVPHVLALYRKFDPGVRFFVAGDEKTPHSDVQTLCNNLGSAPYIPPVGQVRWKCSEPIGWNCIQRRNIALLEAVEWGAEVIYTVDDDNIPVSNKHVWRLLDMFRYDFTGPSISGYAQWFDPGQLLVPPTRQRGFPHSPTPANPFLYTIKGVVNAKIGVVAGTCLGDPDVDAVTRIATHPEVHNTSELLRSGVVVEPGTWTIFNSQNTAFLRELAPAMFMLPGVGRFDDIYASLICQRMMLKHGLHVHLGKPFVWQSRNLHNLVTDLRNEIDGMDNVMAFARYLNQHVSTVEDVWSNMKLCAGIPQRTIEAAQAFLEDIRSVL